MKMLAVHILRSGRIWIDFSADRTNGRAIGTLLRLSSVVCLWREVGLLWLNGAS